MSVDVLKISKPYEVDPAYKRAQKKALEEGKEMPIVSDGMVANVLRHPSIGGVDVRAVLEWGRVEGSFRLPASVVPFLGPNGEPTDRKELLVDVRRSKHVSPEVLVRAMEGDERGRLYFQEAHTSMDQNVAWDWNNGYWKYLNRWEGASGRDYTSFLPAGDAHNPDRLFWEDRIDKLVPRWKLLQGQGALPESIVILEQGVGKGIQARAFLDALKRKSPEHYDRLSYLMCDSSPAMLDEAYATVSHHSDRVQLLPTDAASLSDKYPHLENQVVLIHTRNVYDNLKSREVALRDGDVHEVKVNPYLPANDVARIYTDTGCPPEEIRRQMLSSDLGGVDIKLWAGVWTSLVFSEQYQRVESGGDIGYLKYLKELAQQGDRRFPLSTTPVSSFKDSLVLLHPQSGTIIVDDIFLRKLDGPAVFAGPTKMDGSLYYPVNGELLNLVATERGLETTMEPIKPFNRKSLNHALIAQVPVAV